METSKLADCADSASQPEPERTPPSTTPPAAKPPRTKSAARPFVWLADCGGARRRCRPRRRGCGRRARLGGSTTSSSRGPARARGSRRRRQRLDQRDLQAHGPGVVQITSTIGASTSTNGQFQESSQALGSGFVLDKEGHIVTNYHVIDGATSIEVRFSNDDTLKATLVGSDPPRMSRCSRSRRTPMRSRPSHSPTRRASRLATPSLRSATRSASSAPSRPASSAPSSAP